MRKILHRKMSALIIVMIVLLCHGDVLAVESEGDEAPNVLVVFSSENNEFDEHQRILDMLIGHFTDQIRFVSSSHVVEKDLEQADYLFYYGQHRSYLSSSLVDMVANFSGSVVAIGYNVEQLGDRFSFVTTTNNGVIDRAIVKGKLDKQFSFDPQYVLNTTLSKKHQAEVVMMGNKDDTEFPLFIKHQQDHYFASNILIYPYSNLFAEVLFSVFIKEVEEYTDNTPGYIRLEDIHPLADPDKLMKIAKVLAEKNIPYMMAVIPVYINPETQKQHHLSDHPKLLKTLKFMQDNGGSIVLHGYTHQFRLSETGEGFEFWDVEHNMPIYHDQDEEVTIKGRDDFSSTHEYEQYINKQKAHERAYIEDRLTKGIQELANYGLYPLAFEAPHYTMSQYGYEVASEYFSTYVGQVQLSDVDWEIMATAPYMTKPSFLHGMQLLPETIGYVEPDDPQSIEKMLNKANDYQIVTKGMVAGFYHPYLGVERFIKLIERLEEIQGINWIDLKQMNNYVQTEHLEIKSEHGEIIVHINYLGLIRSSLGYLTYHVKNIITVMLWSIAIIGLLAVINFICRTFFNVYSKNQVKRRYSID